MGCENGHILIESCYTLRKTSHEILDTGDIPILEIGHSRFIFLRQGEALFKFYWGTGASIQKMGKGAMLFTRQCAIERSIRSSAIRCG